MFATALGFALALVHSGGGQDKSGALAPVSSSSEPFSSPAPQSPAPQPTAALPEGFGARPSAASPASAPAFLPGSPPAFRPPPPPPPIDWNALVAAVVETRNVNAQNANAAGAVADSAAGELQRVATVVTNLVLYAAYSPDGQNFLSQLQSSLDAAALPAIAAAQPPELAELPELDFSGLAAVYEAISAQPPPLGFTGPPPELPPSPALPPPPGAEPEGPAGAPLVSPDFLVQPAPQQPIWLPGIAPILGFPF